jgi:hypothetical protein
MIITDKYQINKTYIGSKVDCCNHFDSYPYEYIN